MQSLGETLGRQPQYLKRFPVRQGDHFVLLRLEMIRWIESKGNYVRVHVDGGWYLQRDTLRRLERLLDPDRFVRISRYAIINLDMLRSVERRLHGTFRVQLEGGQELPSTRVYSSVLRQLLQRDAPH